MFPCLRLDYQYLLQEFFYIQLPQALQQRSPKQLGFPKNKLELLILSVMSTLLASKNLNIFESGN